MDQEDTSGGRLEHRSVVDRVLLFTYPIDDSNKDSKPEKQTAKVTRLIYAFRKEL